MDAFLEASVITQNFSLRARLKAVEKKLGDG